MSGLREQVQELLVSDAGDAADDILDGSSLEAGQVRISAARTAEINRRLAHHDLHPEETISIEEFLTDLDQL
jgi:hypothetical protein